MCSTSSPTRRFVYYSNTVNWIIFCSVTFDLCPLLFVQLHVVLSLFLSVSLSLYHCLSVALSPSLTTLQFIWRYESLKSESIFWRLLSIIRHVGGDFLSPHSADPSLRVRNHSTHQSISPILMCDVFYCVASAAVGPRKDMVDARKFREHTR